MITCYVRYEIDPSTTREFETYARMWLPIVEKLGGTHHGYLLPHEGGTFAVALFTFSSLADYEVYRAKRDTDPGCRRAMEYYAETKCFSNMTGPFSGRFLEAAPVSRLVSRTEA